VAIVFDFPVAWIVWNAWVEGEFGNSAARELHVILALSAVLMTIFGSLSLRSTRRELAEKRSDVDQWLRESDT
jgi:hypothetical protein